MNTSPLDYTEKDFEKVINKQVIVDLFSEDDTVSKTYRCKIVKFIVDATIDRTPLFIDIITDKGERLNISIFEIKDIKIL